MMLAIANQPSGGGTTYTTGGDVSRFQRRSVPTKAPTAPSQQDSMTQLATAMMRSNAPAAPAPSTGGSVSVTTSGPVVRISRGNNVTYAPVGSR
jgi:pilus assembly protein CpaB